MDKETNGAFQRAHRQSEEDALAFGTSFSPSGRPLSVMKEIGRRKWAAFYLSAGKAGMQARIARPADVDNMMQAIKSDLPPPQSKENF